MNAISQPGDRRVRVNIEASDFTCEGFVHLPGGRLSDVINESKDFLVVMDAVVIHRRLGSAEQRPFKYEALFLRKGEIKYVVPLENVGENGL